MATAARAAIVVGDAFEDEAAGELQLRYTSCLDGAPLDKAARTHEKLRTLSELMSPFLTPESSDSVVPVSIEVSLLVVVLCVFSVSSVICVDAGFSVVCVKHWCLCAVLFVL